MVNDDISMVNAIHMGHQWLMMVNVPSGYDCYISPWFFDGPNRNRWFTHVYPLKAMVIFEMLKISMLI